jgi:hypothetical protein
MLLRKADTMSLQWSRVRKGVNREKGTDCGKTISQQSRHRVDRVLLRLQDEVDDSRKTLQ